MDRGGRWSQCDRICAVGSRKLWRNQGTEHPDRRHRARSRAWNTLVSSERARLLRRASLVREAKRLFEAVDRRPVPPLRTEAWMKRELALRIEARARGHDGGGLESSKRPRRGHRAGGCPRDGPRRAGVRLLPWPRVGIQSRTAPVALSRDSAREPRLRSPGRHRSDQRLHIAGLRKWDRATVKLAPKSPGLEAEYARYAARHAGRSLPADQDLARRGAASRPGAPGRQPGG